MAGNEGQGSAAPTASSPLLEAGDPAPRVVVLDENGEPAFSHADHLAGRPLVLLFCPTDGSALPESLLAAFRARHGEMAALAVTLFVLSRLPPEVGRATRQVMQLPFKLLSDTSGNVFSGYGIDATGAATVVVLDRNHRVARILRETAPDRLAAATLDYIQHAFPRRQDRLQAHAPVLLLPRVLDEADCLRLIELWNRPVPVWNSADGFTSEGHRREAADFKVGHAGVYGHMTEYVVRDAAVEGFLDRRFNRRVAAEMRKAFQTAVSKRENYRIVRYDSASSGVLHPHRDNPTKETAHRRFTMTINLNAGDYEGGALRFGEYGDHLYEVERGTAVIWSAALLHEVTPVTGGARFVLGVHMYGN